MADGNEPTNVHKEELRARALSRRDLLTDEQKTIAAQMIAGASLPIEFPAGVIVAGYSPINSEIDPYPLMQALQAKGARLALPVIVARDQPLIFRAWLPEQGLVRGQFGIFQPSSDAEDVDPDVVLVPLAAFDRAGHRIGYGRGYYDRTLQDLRSMKKITAVGVAFAVQEIEVVPALNHDEQLDCVLTEKELIDLRRV